jgi:hypothetical protein
MYLINKIPPGEYVLRAIYVGYETITFHGVKVDSGKTTAADFTMPVEGTSTLAPQTVVDTTVVRKDIPHHPPAATVKQ